jgi:hypothetical protein
MNWRSLISTKFLEILPWCGSRKICNAKRIWTINGNTPKEHGWYVFSLDGSKFAVLHEDEMQGADLKYESEHNIISGYVVGNRFITDDSKINVDPDKLIDQTETVYCVEHGLDHIVKASVIRNMLGKLIFIRQDFSVGPEDEVLEAIRNKKYDIDDIKGVTPALELAFRWVSVKRRELEEHRRYLQMLHDADTAIGRRNIVNANFELAAQHALKVSGADLIDVRNSCNVNEKIVQYRFRDMRFECVVDRNTLRIIDAGICLTDESTGEKGDSYFTLESLPGVIDEAINRNRLVIYRHVGS